MNTLSEVLRDPHGSADELDRLRKGIQDYLDGNYGRGIKRKIDHCRHGLYGYESCENCIDEYFKALLMVSRSP